MDTMAIYVTLIGRVWSHLLGTSCHTLGSWSQAKRTSVGAGKCPWIASLYYHYNLGQNQGKAKQSKVESGVCRRCEHWPLPAIIKELV